MLLQDKFLLLVILLLASLDFAGALEFGAKPSTISMEIETSESECKKISLFSSAVIDRVSVSDFWSTQESKELIDYNKLSSDFKIDIDYDNYIEVEYKKEFDFCLKAKDAGKYNGVILFDVVDSNAVIGVWINLDVYEQKSFRKISGFSIFSEYGANALFLQIVFTFILSIIFIYLVIKAKN